MVLSRQGRRLTGPVPRWVGGLGSFILFAYAAAFALNTPSNVEAVNVTYVIGVAGLADVELISPDGRSQRARTGSVRQDLVFHHGDKVSVVATGVGGVLASCRLLIRDVLVAEFTGQSAACSGKIGDPATYMPPPTRGLVNVAAPIGEVMQLPRYSGRSSPVSGRLTDRAAGISYARLGGGWGPPTADQQPGWFGSMLTLRQESRPERGWFSMYGSARMDPELLYRYVGERRLFQAALAQQDALTRLFSLDTSYRDIVSQPLTVDGRKAWVITRHFTIGPKASTTIRSELNTLVLIDTGRERPAYLFVNMSDPSHDYLPDVNRLISSIRVL